ncbi:hypothetical protein FOXG_22210 [Fusarium oxysporum f. sp. lycopersici 4287]|uniref:Uncharacterized protein n=1 Tax=Fusarium oxysporum f. sp. lycopersici (strain 4287 / CBS 123668 / FGSC 9935 / NRRL 34936) TaxID=426428 RepID=A0A0J9WUI9_FUSO4|nr:hypothetical protein FOXG_22077 [Fusarium oxysporum f. sp. lycopersici 4287]XP_018256416.1 uncharacterized protein FOXG_22210 [Fusarium oxysporum f. sp. lycopersici 4287]KAJ9419906.1 hypothetical protein QL093DRAFT_2565840 [Fusarium oxysporum]KNB17862.1 hypothetical protein FOXG_22077 [Fusarium oxysporum f. sp. lycopersici 4287]KNB18371.1 hypothetical protein FOXG_22210 [Fusarium oxysporum f. sp. lycopersici 4287]
MNEETPLLAGPVRDTVNFHYSLPFCVKFLACIMLGILPLLDSVIFKSLDAICGNHFHKLFSIWRFLLPFICDHLQAGCWRHLQPTLENVSYFCLIQGQALTSQAAAKSLSLDTVLKGIVLKALPTAVAIGEALNILLPWWLALFIVIAVLCFMGSTSYFVFIPLAKKMQEVKAKRDKARREELDDSVEQTQYVACLKLGAYVRNFELIILGLGLIAFISSVELEGNERQYYRLVAKLFSMDEAFNKMAQSFANASAIISLAQTWKSLARNIYRACEETWKVSPMALDKVQDFQPLMEISANFLSVLKADRRSRRAGRSESQLLAKFNSQ